MEDKGYELGEKDEENVRGGDGGTFAQAALIYLLVVVMGQRPW